MEQSILFGDYMGRVIYLEEMVVSESILSAIEDSGLFKINSLIPI